MREQRGHAKMCAYLILTKEEVGQKTLQPSTSEDATIFEEDPTVSYNHYYTRTIEKPIFLLPNICPQRKF